MDSSPVRAGVAQRTVASHTLRGGLARMFSAGLLAVGGLLLLAAVAYAAYAQLNSWVMEQEYYLIADELAGLPIPTLAWTPTPFASPTVAAVGSLSAEAVPEQLKRNRKVKAPTPMPSRTVTAHPTETATPTLIPVGTVAAVTAAPTSLPSSPPAKIRIPRLHVTRSIINLPRVRDRSSGAWTWNTDRLFRSGRLDLVGHSEGSANPGQEGNLILVGHNYGIGQNGVFVGLTRLRSGDKVQVVTKSGETFTYRVTTVQRVKWRRKNFAELTQHLNFLAIGGRERLTLVSCTGADFEPFPERIYVVADPVR